MADVQLSRAARADLVAIDEYSAEQFGQDTADAYLRRFNDVFDLLARQPLAGARYSQIDARLRCFVHRSHRVFYTVDGEHVLIVRVLHHAQDAPRLLGN